MTNHAAPTSTVRTTVRTTARTAARTSLPDPIPTPAARSARAGAPSRLRRRLRGAALVLVAPLLALGAAACQPSGCQVDCITSVALNPGATTATLATTVPTTAVIEVYKDSARTQLVAKAKSDLLATSHPLPVGPLKASTTYWYKVTATDAGANWRSETGSVTTFARKVTVTITRIHLIDDSDSAGTGEIDFHLKVNDAGFPNVYVDGDMGSGTDLTNLSITRSAPASLPSLTILVEGRDDDCDSILTVCPTGSYPGFDSGTDSDWDWATASTGAVALPAQNGSGNWSVKTTAYALDFEASGTWSVAYTPF